MSDELIEVLSNCTEEELFCYIHEMTYRAWRLGHDAADDRIPDDAELQESIDYWNGLGFEGMKQVVRFGIEPFIDESCCKTPTKEYITWYKKCKELYINDK